jgi:hypothetical protein
MLWLNSFLLSLCNALPLAIGRLIRPSGCPIFGALFLLSAPLPLHSVSLP